MTKQNCAAPVMHADLEEVTDDSCTCLNSVEQAEQLSRLRREPTVDRADRLQRLSYLGRSHLISSPSYRMQLAYVERGDWARRAGRCGGPSPHTDERPLP